MDDAMKGAGIVTGGGFAIGIVMVVYRVIQDGVLLYAVVFGGMTIFGIAAAGVSFLLLRHALEARRLQLDASLTSARIMRTLDGVAAQRPALSSGNDLLTQLITGAGADQVVDADVKYSALPDGDDD